MAVSVILVKRQSSRSIVSKDCPQPTQTYVKCHPATVVDCADALFIVATLANWNGQWNG